QHRSRGDLFSVFELDHVPIGARFQRFGVVGARDPCIELARLGGRAADEFGAADARGEAEVVLDPARRSRLPADGGALEYQGLETLRGAVDGRGEPGGPAADDHQIYLLALFEPAADAKRTRQFAVARSW